MHPDNFASSPTAGRLFTVDLIEVLAIDELPAKIQNLFYFVLIISIL
jgi:hypothetical protein